MRGRRRRSFIWVFSVGTRDMVGLAAQQGVSRVDEITGARFHQGHVVGRCAGEDITLLVAVIEPHIGNTTAGSLR